MELRRIYLPAWQGESEVQIREAEAIARLIKVLRMKVGFRVLIFNGRGEEAELELTTIATKEIKGKVVRAWPNLPMVSPEIWIYQALAKPLSKFETVLQKATELGVHGFVPLEAERSEAERVKLSRWEEILVQAAEQCRRGDIPVLEPVSKLSALPEGENIIFECEGAEEWKAVVPELKKAARVNFFIGPEGGWSEGELTFFRKRGARVVRLPGYVLRTETVAPCVVASLLWS